MSINSIIVIVSSTIGSFSIKRKHCGKETKVLTVYKGIVCKYLEGYNSLPRTTLLRTINVCLVLFFFFFFFSKKKFNNGPDHGEKISQGIQQGRPLYLYQYSYTITSGYKLTTKLTLNLVISPIVNSQPRFLGFRSDHRELRDC